MLDLASDVFDDSRFEVAALPLVRFFLGGLSLSFAVVSASTLGVSEGCEYLSFSRFETTNSLVARFLLPSTRPSPSISFMSLKSTLVSRFILRLPPRFPLRFSFLKGHYRLGADHLLHVLAVFRQRFACH